jgi:predicted nucleic acid-binding protein
LYKFGIQKAHDWLQEIQETAVLLNPTLQDYQEATALAVRYWDQDLSLFDAVAAVISGRLSLPIWTYDRHFDVMRAEVWHGA